MAEDEALEAEEQKAKYYGGYGKPKGHGIPFSYADCSAARTCMKRGASLARCMYFSLFYVVVFFHYLCCLKCVMMVEPTLPAMMASSGRTGIMMRPQESWAPTTAVM